MLLPDERGKFLAAALKAGEQPVEVDCTGVSKDKMRNIHKVLAAEILNEKTGHWDKVQLTEYFDSCPICGKLMRVRAIVGTTWIPACCEQHTRQILEELDNGEV